MPFCVRAGRKNLKLNKLNRTYFQRIAEERVVEAKAPYAAKRYPGGGGPVECALKAVICRKTQMHSFPDKKQSDEMYTHNLVKLLGLSGLDSVHAAQARIDPVFARNWNTIKDWSEASRYKMNAHYRARDLISAVDGGPSSFMPWVQTRW